MTWTKREILDLLEKASNAGVDIQLSDEQIVSSLSFRKAPASDLGIAVMKHVVKTIEQYADKPAPSRFKVYEKQWPENKIEVYLFSNEGKLCGKDILNSIYVLNGNAFSVPTNSDEFKNVREGGKKFYNLAECFAALVGHRVESMQGDFEVVEMNEIKGFDSANISIPNFLARFFEKNNKEIGLDSLIDTKVEIKLL